MEVGGRGEIVYLSLHCRHQNDSSIKVGSDESHFNVSLIVRGKSHKTVSTGHNFWRERRTEADSNRGLSAYQPNALPLGQTGSRIPVPNIVLKYGLCGRKATLEEEEEQQQKQQQQQQQRQQQKSERARLA